MKRDQKIALSAAGLAMLAEVPISKKYQITPPVTPVARYLVAGGMTYVAVLIATSLIASE